MVDRRARKLRAGIIGLGTMGRHHVRVLSSLDGVELVAVADPAGDAAHSAFGLPVLAGVEEMIEFGVDYCVVAAPTTCHHEIGLALGAAGVPALIEKPLASDAAKARDLVSAFAATGTLGAVGHIERFNPALQNARRRIADGQLGRVYQIVTRRQGPFPARISDVGVISDLATHDIDLTSWLAQQPYASVAAHVAYQSGRRHEDLVVATGSLRDGTITNHLVNWLSPMKERVTVITGERGALVADTLTADLTFYANSAATEDAHAWDSIALFRGVSEGDVIRYAFPKVEPLRTEHENFRDAVLGLPSDIVTLEQGLATVTVAEAVLTSATTRQAITLPAPDQTPSITLPRNRRASDRTAPITGPSTRP